MYRDKDELERYWKDDIMAEFEIQLGKTTEWAAAVNEYSSELRQQKGRVDSVARQLAFRSGYKGIDIALAGIASNINKQQTQMKQYGGMLGNIVRAYKGAESSIVAKVTPDMKIENAADNSLDLLLPLLSKFGVAGSTSSTLLKLWKNSLNGIDTKDVLSLLKGADGLAGQIAGMAGKKAADRNWADFWLGNISKSIFDDLDGVKPASSGWAKWKAYMKKELSMEDYKFSVGRNAKAASNVKAATKWAGAALSFAITALDNKEEQGGVMNGRAWEETIVETGLGALEGLAVGAAVGAAAAAIGGAPVLVAGAATVGVTWLVDMGYKAISGSRDGLIEDASDWVCDRVETAGKAVGNWAKSTWNSVTDFFSGGKRKPAYAG